MTPERLKDYRAYENIFLNKERKGLMGIGAIISAQIVNKKLVY